MHSIVVLGEVRTHISTIENDLWRREGSDSTGNLQCTDLIPEGAYFLQRAVEAVVNPANLQNPPLSTTNDLCNLESYISARMPRPEYFDKEIQNIQRLLNYIDELILLRNNANTNAGQVGLELPNESEPLRGRLAEITKKRDESEHTRNELDAVLKLITQAKTQLKNAREASDVVKKQSAEIESSEATLDVSPQALKRRINATNKLNEKRNDAEKFENECRTTLQKIRDALTRQTFIGHIKVFGVSSVEPHENNYVPGPQYQWKLRLVSMPEGKDKRARQVRLDKNNELNSNPRGKQDLTNNLTPLISIELLNALNPKSLENLENLENVDEDDAGELKPGYFEPRDPHNRFQIPQCPDIVVVDDRGYEIVRGMQIPRTAEWVTEKAYKLASKLHRRLLLGKACSKCKELLQELGCIDVPVSEFYLDRTPEEYLRGCLLKWTLANLCERLKIPQGRSREDHRPTMEPVVICSIMGNPLNIFEFGGNLYDQLYENEWLRDRTIILLDAEDLRNGRDPVAINSGLSWERTAQDTIAGLRKALSTSKKTLLGFGQVIVRYGVTGALHIVRRGDDQYSYRLYFDPRYDDAVWSDEMTKTHVFGRVAVVAASLVETLTKTCEGRHGHPFIHELPIAVSTSMESAIRRSQALARFSYGGTYKEYIDLKMSHWLPIDLFGDPKKDPTGMYFASAEIPPIVLGNWSILGQHSQSNLAQVASEIVKEGPNVIPRKSIPVLRYQEGGENFSFVVDRREVEGYRAIEKLIRSHVERHKSNRNRDERPLSFAVFGPPGSGKSTAVKRIIEELNRELNAPFEPKPRTYNLSQYSKIEELGEAFREIELADKIPIAFFDEFDCKFPGDDEQTLGWLKYFLAPMEDGVFRDHRLGNAVLVFAGGTSVNFSEFNLESRSASDDQWLEFSRAKGPDFVSRLSGHLNIIGVNPSDPDDELYLIRRAVVVHSLLRRIRQGNGVQSRDAIDDDMIRAVLHVPEYRHGGRSLRMLLESCVDSSGRISVSAVPPIHQLNMLVDGKAFLSLVSNIASSGGGGCTSSQ